MEMYLYIDSDVQYFIWPLTAETTPNNHHSGHLQVGGQIQDSKNVFISGLPY